MRRRVAPRLLRMGRRLYAWVFRVPVEREVEEEVDFHLDMRVREYVAAGMSPEDARKRAESGFGDLARVKADMTRLGEEREARMTRTVWWDEVRQDGRLALRQVVRRPAFAVVATLTLAGSIGANTAVFSVVRGVLLRPLPYEEPGELVALWTRYLPSSGLDIPRFPLSGPELLDYRDQAEAVEAVAPYAGTTVTVSGPSGEPERLGATAAGRGLFGLLGARPALGRFFSDEELLPGSAPTAVLGHALWVRRFGADPTVVGRSVELDGRPAVVVGVARPGFVFPSAATELWVPLRLDEQNPGGRGGHGLAAVGRLAPGIALEEARAELETITAGWNEQYEHHAMGHFVFLTPLAEDLLGDVRPVLALLMTAVGLVLLIACANVGNLFLARSEARQREMAVRSAMGAGRARLARQLLVEGLVLSMLGAALGLALAWLALPALLAIDPSALPRSESVRVDGAVLAFTAGLVVLTTVLFGLLPSLRGRGGVVEGLREGRASVTGGGTRLRRYLVAGEVALSLLVVLASGLVLRSLLTLRAVDPGVRTEAVLTFRLSIPSSSYPEATQVVRFYEDVTERVLSLPGVLQAGAVSALPLTGLPNRNDFLPEGEPPPPPGVPSWNAQLLAALPGYFATMEVPLRAGRLPGADDRAEGVPVAVLNEAAVRRYFDGRAPLGRRISFNWSSESPLWITVVGVVADTRHAVDEEPEPAVYLSHAQLAAAGMGQGRNMTVVARSGGDPAALAPALRAAVAELDPRLPLANLATMEEVAARSVARPRLTAHLLGGFAALALLLATVGIYGVVSYSVERRTREIGLRMALGADRRRVARMILAESARPAVAGAGVGLVAALVLSGPVESLLFGVVARDPLTFTVVPAGLVAVALLASWIPARRATRVDPMLALGAD